MKKLSLIFIILCAAGIIYGQDCINLEISDDCAENQTIITATSETILFSAVGNWNQGEIDYQIRHGRDLLKMNVQANGDQLLIIVIYNNYRASLYMDPQTGMISTNDTITFNNLINTMSTSFKTELQAFVDQIQAPTGNTEELVGLHNALSNSQMQSVPIGGMIRVGDIWDPGVYAICWHACMIGCLYMGDTFENCSLECKVECSIK